MRRPRLRPSPWPLTVIIGTAAVLVGCAAGPETAPTLGPATPVGTPAVSASPSATATPSAGTPRPGSPTPAEPTCAQVTDRLTLEQQVGQLLMVAVSSTGLGSATAESLARTRAGSAILLGNSTGGRAAARAVVGDVRDAMLAPRGVRGIVAADQEGGLVQRLQGPGFDRIPSAVEQSRTSDRALTRTATRWGDQLDAAGIDANLAPVADVVPRSLLTVNAPIGRLHRGYGSDPEKVAAKVTAFHAGMEAAGIATAVKHFPGLGRVRGNTDFSRDVVDSVTTRHDTALAGFRAAVEAGVPMVMVSSATYAKIDADHPAVFSSTVITGMLRQDLGFDRVVISDDLSAEALADVSPGRRAVRFVTAGGDLAIVGNPVQVPAMAAALRTEAKDDPAFARRLQASATRVLVMKAEQGLADCRPG